MQQIILFYRKYKLRFIFQDLAQMWKILLLLTFTTLFISLVDARWSEEQAWKWYNNTNWSAGVNYIPAYAANQIQMWEKWNSSAVHQELQWASNIGFSKFRIFLHIQPFIDNKSQFLKNVFFMLTLLKGIKAQAILVLFDDCWNPTFHGGAQPDPIPGVHNSQWVQCPGTNLLQDSDYENYVKTILRTFGSNENVAVWDLYNQVGNSGHYGKSLPLLKKIFSWARQINPPQPLTSGKWAITPQFVEINEFIIKQSDIITFHAYCDVACTKLWIQQMKLHKRPVICTQYMARLMDSKFITHLPVFKGEGVWAINWGFVFGRTQTYYPWGSKEGSPVPKVWFHDVVHPDGSAFDPKQTQFIQNITKV